MNGREEIVLEHLLDLIPVDHLPEYPSTDKAVTINLHDFLRIHEIIHDMAIVLKVPHLLSTPQILDTILDKVNEWMPGVHLSFEKILEPIHLLLLLLVELLQKGNRRKTSLGQHRRNLGMKVVNRQVRSLLTGMARVTVLPIELLMKVRLYRNNRKTTIMLTCRLR